MSIGAWAKTASATPSACPGRSSMIGGVELSIISSRCGTTVSAVVSRAGRPCSAGAVAQGAHGREDRRKKECLNLTNKAIMLLKTKGRENEQSRTKPIKPKGVCRKVLQEWASPSPARLLYFPRGVGGFRPPRIPARNWLTASPCTGIF